MSLTNAIDLTKSRMAHPGGKLSSNKEKAQAKFLARLRKKGTENLSTTQRLALSRIPGGAVLLRETYGIPSSSSSSSSSSASFHKQNRNKTKKQNRQRGGNSTANKRQYSKFQSNNSNNNSNNQQTTARLSSKKRKKGASSVFVPNKKSSQPDLTAKLNMSLDDLC